MRAPPRDAEPHRPSSTLSSYVAALSTLLVHSGLALWLAMPSTFNKYGLAAQHHLAGTLPTERWMDFSPLYLQLSLWGERLLEHPGPALQGLQIALAAAAVGIFHHLLRRRVSAPWAGLAAAALALDPLLLVYERIFEPEIFQLVLLLAIIALLESRRRHAPWMAGILAALCLATRPTFLPAFLAVPLFYRWRRHRLSAGPMSWRRASIAFALPLIAALALLAWRADRATGDWRTPSMNPGTVFFEGNNPLSRGTSAIYPPVVLSMIQRSQQQIPDSGHVHYRRLARAVHGDATMSIRRVNAYWSGKAWHFIRREPGVFVEGLLRKVLYACHSFRWHDVPAAWKYESTLPPLPSVPFALLSALALFGTLLEARRWQRSLLFYSLAAVQLAVMVVFYVSARQRLAILPAVIYFAVLALRHLYGLGRGGLLRSILVLLLALSLWLPDAAMRDEAYRRQNFNTAEGLFDEARRLADGQATAAGQALIVEAFVHVPWWLDGLYPTYFPRTSGALEARVLDGLIRRQVPAAFDDSWRFDLATLHLRFRPQGFDDAIAPLLGRTSPPVYRGGRQSSEPSLLVARRLVVLGRHGEARQALSDALRSTPGDPFVLAAQVALDDNADARQTLFDCWSRADAQLLLGHALLDMGRAEAAAGPLESLLVDLPELRQARIYLAVALARQGQDDEAVAQYLTAAAEAPQPLLYPDEVIALFERWAQAHAEDPRSIFYAAQILHRHGAFEAARQLLLSRPPPPDVAGRWRQELSQVEAHRLAAQASTNEP